MKVSDVQQDVAVYMFLSTSRRRNLSTRAHISVAGCPHDCADNCVSQPGLCYSELYAEIQYKHTSLQLTVLLTTMLSLLIV